MRRSHHWKRRKKRRNSKNRKNLTQVCQHLSPSPAEVSLHLLQINSCKKASRSMDSWISRLYEPKKSFKNEIYCRSWRHWRCSTIIFLHLCLNLQRRPNEPHEEENISVASAPPKCIIHPIGGHLWENMDVSIDVTMITIHKELESRKSRIDLHRQSQTDHQDSS